MPWEYLQTLEADKRFEVGKLLPEYLDVLDLNAGSCRFSKYYPYKKYYANDIDENYNPGGIDFQPISDVKMVEYMKDKHFDVLCAFALGAGDKYQTDYESPTLRQSILTLLLRKPTYVILEASRAYVEKYNVIDDIIMDFPVEYSTLFSKKIPGQGTYGRRVVKLLTLKT
jgi:hypothetical protein